VFISAAFHTSEGIFVELNTWKTVLFKNLIVVLIV
jgi:hypothetical protein